MKLSLFPIAVLSVALAAAAACANSDDTDTTPPPVQDGGTTTLPEAGPVVDAAVEAAPIDAGNQVCSDAGWCTTAVPGPGTSIQDIWPLEQHAFALAVSTTTVLSPGTTKILEWDEATQQWGYIDDDSQNSAGFQTTGNIWAPNDDEVYFVGSNLSAAIMFHGQRPVAPSTTWTWTRTDFTCAVPGFDFPQVWGTSATDVYLWGCQTIYHKQAADAGADAGDSGVSGWVKEFSDPASPIGSIAITGTGPDDVWFVGTRADALTWFFLGAGCTTLVHKTAAGYHAVVDADGACGKIGNLPVVQGVFATYNGTGSAFAPSKGELIGVYRGQPGTPGNYMVKVDTDDTDGGTTAVQGPPTELYYMDDSWGTAGSTPFALAEISMSSFVLRGPDAWTDAGTYQISTLIRNSKPNIGHLNRIRGSSLTNIWAVGDDNAYHKTTTP